MNNFLEKGHDMEQEIKNTVAVSSNLENFDTENLYVSPEFFYMHSNDELEKFVHQMVVTYKKNVMIYQGKY